ncbi:YqgE/AlgH family protein [Limnohabitans sp.]|uniref:YqgE/AlgH family protein n=1 Tax=Limnohabitans sp. TaxID=1907725 RepID=UPI00286F1781|nr:YqgE/AlgH family protein [Limnohabitans sp.]
MTADSASINLTHHFLIAMPGLEDEAFAKSVVYVCEHSERGALGLVINKPGELSMKCLFEKVDLPLHRQDLMNAPVLQGGPVHTERGFVLHDAMWADVPVDVAVQDLAIEAAQEETVEAAQEAAALSAVSGKESVYASTMTIPGGLEMTTSKDVLEALSVGAGPQRVLISLGYSAWGEGQLESELAENSWLTVGADTAVIFDTPVERRYERAMQLLGLESWMLSGEVGHS